MTFRGTTLGWSLACAALLSACGGSDIVGQLQPSRIVSFGDGYTELRAGAEWTVKDVAQPVVWVRQLAERYNLAGGSLASVADGGFGYAQGGAALVCRDDAVHPCTGSPSSLAQQIAQARQNGHVTPDALMAIMIGATDGVHYATLARNGVIDDATLQQRMQAAGTALYQELRALTDAGLKVVVIKTPKLGDTPLGLADEALKAKLALATEALNGALLSLLGAEDTRIDGRDLALVDGERLFDINVGDDIESTAGFLPTREPACGVGVTALACTGVAPGASSQSWVFAAEVYPTPGFHRYLGNETYNITRFRF